MEMPSTIIKFIPYKKFGQDKRIVIITYSLCIDVFQFLFAILNNLSSAQYADMFLLGCLSVELYNSQLTLITCCL